VYGINTTATKEGNKSFESVTEFKYFGTALTDQNPFYEDIKSRLNFGECFSAKSFVFLVRYKRMCILKYTELLYILKNQLFALKYTLETFTH